MLHELTLYISIYIFDKHFIFLILCCEVKILVFLITMSNYLHIMITHITIFEKLHHVNFVSFKSLGIDFIKINKKLLKKYMVKLGTDVTA